MNYRQLEEEINKWSVELEDQEKIFIQQATQVNAWDRLLIDNGEKVTESQHVHVITAAYKTRGFVVFVLLFRSR